MNNISKRRLGDIVNFKRGYDLPIQNRKVGNYPILSSSGISGYHSDYKADGEGLVTGRYGTLGEVYYINGRYWPHNTALYVTDFKGNYPKYVYYLMKVLGNLKTSDKSTVPGINRNDLHEIIVPYLVRTFQKQPADFLFLLDSKIELNNRINAELEGMAKLIYDYWFVQFDFPFDFAQGKPNEQGKPYKSSGGKMVWNEELKREIPEGWEVKSLFNVCDVQYGFPFSTTYFNEEGNGVPVIRIRDILENSVSNYSTEKEVNKKYLIKKGDLLIGMDGNFHINYWSVEGCYLNQRVVKFSETILPIIFLKYQVEPFIKLREKSVSRTTVGHLSDKDLKSIRIIIPSKEVTNSIKNLYKNSLDKIIQNKLENQHLTSLRDWLLPMLMNGQVSIRENEQSAPAMAAEDGGRYVGKCFK